MPRLSNKKLINDFTEGPIIGPLARFALPFMLSNALQVFYNLVDMLIVGRYMGKVGLASVINAGKVFVFLTMISAGLSTSGQIYISQLIGQKRTDALSTAIGTFFSTCLLIGCAASILGTTFSLDVLKLIDVPPEALPGAHSYLMVCAAGTVFSFGYNMVSAVLRGMGDSMRPFLFVAIASVANLLLDVLFIAGLGMGTFGAGLATIMGQALSFVFAVVYLGRRKEDFHFDFKPRSFRIVPSVFRAQMRLGLPFAVRFAAINISMIYVLKLVNGLGIAASAVFGIGIQVDDIVTKVTQGIMQASTAMVGQNYGARKFERIGKVMVSAWALSLGFYVVYTYFLLFHTEGLFGIFTDDAEVLALAPVFAWTIVWQFPGLILMRGTNGFINGIGNARLSLLFGLLDGVVLRIGCSWALGTWMGLGLKGYVLGYGIACYGLCIPSIIYYLFFPWERRSAVTR